MVKASKPPSKKKSAIRELAKEARGEGGRRSYEFTTEGAVAEDIKGASLPGSRLWYLPLIAWTVPEREFPESSAPWAVAETDNEVARYACLLRNLDPEASAVTTMKEVRERLDQGLKKQSLDRLSSVLGATKGSVSDVVRVPQRTLARRDTLRSVESERLFRLGNVFQRALEVLGGLETARQWMRSPKRALDGEIPFDLCRTEIGAKEVLDLLGRLEHGVIT